MCFVDLDVSSRSLIKHGDTDATLNHSVSLVCSFIFLA